MLSWEYFLNRILLTALPAFERLATHQYNPASAGFFIAIAEAQIPAQPFHYAAARHLLNCHS